MLEPWLPIFITLLHSFFTAIWIGGMVTLAWALLPAARGVMEATSEVRELTTRVQRRLSILIYVSIVGLWATGFAMARRTGAGAVLNFETASSTLLSIKHLVVLMMVAVALIRSIGGRQRVNPLSAPKWQGALLITNLVLGLVVLGLSAAMAVTGGGA